MKNLAIASILGPQMTRNNHILAHNNSSYHRKELFASDICGCFYCLKTFNSNEIKEWIDSNDSALCPYCGIDAVIGSSSGYNIDKDFLKEMKDYWF